VAAVFWQAGPWLPLILALETVQLLSDVMAMRWLLRHCLGDIPWSTWVRSSAVAYAMMILLPAGRAAGEVARATLLARHVGTKAAATAGAQLQTAYVGAILVASALEGVTVAVAFGASTPLAWLLGGNALLMAVTCAGLLALLWDARAARWLEGLRRRLPGASDAKAHWDPGPRRSVPLQAGVICACGRATQIFQYGVILAAVGGTPNARGALVAHGVHLVGATAGDVVPNQLGIVDGTYSAFAGALGLGDNPARALSIAFVAHAAQLTLAALCVLVAAVTRDVASPSSADRPSVHAGARS
jgi:uncharacterized membrane protein YbhN (UPF0104 family)